MSNATHDPNNSGDSRRRRSRGGSNRNRNRNRSDNDSNQRGDREGRSERGNNQGRQASPRAEEFRPQAPRKYAPPKPTFWQKILSIFGLYKAPAPPSRYDRNTSAGNQESTPFPKTSSKSAPKSNTRNVRSGDGESRPPREPREPREQREPREPRENSTDGERPPRKERAPRGDKPRGGDPKSVESTRVYVGNLSYDVSEQDLQELFKGVGGVRNVEIVYNRSTHRSKGYGFVEMLRMDDAIRSVEVLHDQPFMGRKMTVSGAKSKGQDEREDAEGRDEAKPARVKLAPLPTATAETPAVEASDAEGPVAETQAVETQAVETQAVKIAEVSDVETIEAPAAETTEAPVAAAEVADAPALVDEAAVEPTIETIIEQVEEVPAAAEESASDLQAKYGFDEPKEKSEDA